MWFEPWEAHVLCGGKSLEPSPLSVSERVHKASRIAEAHLSVSRGFRRTPRKSGAYLLVIYDFVFFHVGVKNV